MLDTSRISTRGKIWELHIHSNQCFSADENLKRLSVDEYVTQLLDILEPDYFTAFATPFQTSLLQCSTVG